MNEALPSYACRRWDGGGWTRHAAVSLCDTVSGKPPAQATTVRAAWDDQCWRLRFEAEDSRPWATITERDGPLWTEEVVEVFFDPVGDLAGYFEVEVNPLGAVADLVLRRTSSGWRKDFSWSVEGLETSVHAAAGGWGAELAIPFAALGPDCPEIGSRWRVNFLRIDRPGGPDTEPELSAWSPTGARNFHRAERFGTMSFEE